MCCPAHRAIKAVVATKVVVRMALAREVVVRVALAKTVVLAKAVASGVVRVVVDSKKFRVISASWTEMTS